MNAAAETPLNELVDRALERMATGKFRMLLDSPEPTEGSSSSPPAIAQEIARRAALYQPIVAFGEGKVVVDTGTAHGRPAVFIAPAKNPGEVGASAAREGHDLHSLQPGEIVLTFPTMEQAKAVDDALIAAPQPAQGAEAVRVKPLEWGRDLIRGYWYGNAAFPPHYRVSGDKWCFVGREGAQYICDSEEAAKAAAQADYEQRILSAFAAPEAAQEEQP